MRRTPLSMLAHWAQGTVHGEDVAIDGLSNDTRAIVPGSLYVALRGERFDGHDFAAAAQAAGAAALLVERVLDIDLPQLVALMTCVFSTLDNAVTLVHSSGETDIGQWPRALLALSGLAAGFVFDWKSRQYMGPIMYCVMMLSTTDR